MISVVVVIIFCLKEHEENILNEPVHRWIQDTKSFLHCKLQRKLTHTYLFILDYSWKVNYY